MNVLTILQLTFQNFELQSFHAGGFGRHTSKCCGFTTVAQGHAQNHIFLLYLGTLDRNGGASVSFIAVIVT